uniref:Granzyme B(G,H)-like n=1 Tax=Lepisosteus oculatus TaxID=7918 RepID=W5MDG1_LEPOC|nr:PREDICTED: granzyme B(G,H)-like [Lepisosteus oculatus]
MRFQPESRRTAQTPSMVTLCVLVMLTLVSALAGVSGDEIIGGHEVSKHSRPYMAYLLIGRERRKTSCGGFLIRDDFIMTAAHCKGLTYTVLLGAHNILEDEAAQQVIPVEKAIPHPNYTNINYQNDIMMLKLQKKARLSHEVNLIPLPADQSSVGAGAECCVAGWGSVNKKGRKLSNTLLEVTVTVKSLQACRDHWGEEFNEMNICAGVPERGVCKGDSGGPLVCNGVAHGVVSYGSKPCEKKPSVYTNISAFIPWIKDILGKN